MALHPDIIAEPEAACQPVRHKAARSARQCGDAARARRYRQRDRNGRAIVPVEIDLEPITAYLVDRELLPLHQVEDRKAIGIAVGELLDLLLNMARRHV